MKNLYDRIQERILQLVAIRLEEHRISRLTTAPDFAKFMYEEKGTGWDTFLKSTPGSELKVKLESQLWREALCDVLSAMAESQVALENRIQDLESKLQEKK